VVARELVAEEALPVTELYRALVGLGAIEDDTPKLYAGFRHQVREAQRAGTFSELPKAKTGPAKGETWSEDRRAVHEPSAAEVQDARRSRCAEHIRDELFDHRVIALDPSKLAEFADLGWGEAVVTAALHRLRRLGRAKVTFSHFYGATIILVVRPFDED
jgi:hypothetical protein